jgi:16S rRNA (cytidine1402-2'-O)-methyltransferase
MNKRLYLIPVSLDEETSITNTLPNDVIEIVKELKVFIVENEKTARAYLKKIGITTPQIDLIILLHSKKDKLPISQYFKLFENTDAVGLMSEAGCPGIADPGAEVIREAHKRNIEVIPFVGPSSILMALMAAGFNGQQFTFVGYLPIDKSDRIKRIKDLEMVSEKYNITQIFIETPFRNNHLFDDVVKNCKPNTSLSIGVDITGINQNLKTRTIAEWRENKPELHKRPAVFVLYAR